MMDGLTLAQYLERGNASLDAENSIEAMRNFARGHLTDRNDQRPLRGFQAALSLYTRQIRTNYIAENFPVYHGTERIMTENARVFYQPGMSAFLNGEYEVSRVWFSEAISWDPTNDHLLDCFRMSVELGDRQAQRIRRRQW